MIFLFDVQLRNKYDDDDDTGVWPTNHAYPVNVVKMITRCRWHQYLNCTSLKLSPNNGSNTARR